MDFSLTPAQENLRQMVQWFAANRVRPLALEADRTGRYPDDFLRELQTIGAGQGMMGGGEASADRARSSSPEERPLV